MPLISYQDISTFKLFLNDVGLLSAMTNLSIKTFVTGDELFTQFKGALTEQFVLQQLRSIELDYIGYWTNEKSTTEVDFVIQHKGKIIPIEVKSGENLRAKSFKHFCSKYKPEVAIRTSLTDFKKESWMINVPLYIIGDFFN